MIHYKYMQLTKNFLFYSFLILLSCLCLAPIIIMVVTSVKTKVQIFDDMSLFLFMPTISNYSAVLQDSDRIDYFLNSELFQQD
jgi:multiple sugar transport system permease protein